jgi:hypothetical protein
LFDIKVKGIPVISTNDINNEDNKIKLQEIDPFTFIGSVEGNDGRYRILLSFYGKNKYKSYFGWTTD